LAQNRLGLGLRASKGLANFTIGHVSVPVEVIADGSGASRPWRDFHWRVVVPPNTTAEVHVPTTDAETVTENGWPVNEAQRRIVTG